MSLSLSQAFGGVCFTLTLQGAARLNAFQRHTDRTQRVKPIYFCSQPQRASIGTVGTRHDSGPAEQKESAVDMGRWVCNRKKKREKNLYLHGSSTHAATDTTIHPVIYTCAYCREKRSYDGVDGDVCSSMSRSSMSEMKNKKNLLSI